MPESKTVTPRNTFVRGEGMSVFLEDDTRIEDWSGAACTNNIGLGREEMARALSDQTLRLSFMSPGMFAKTRLALVEDLQTILPHGISVPYFGIGGSDSIEAAIRAARMVTRRKNVLTFTTSYHGDTITLESVSGGGVQEYGDMRPWAVHAPSPYDCFQDLGDWDRAYERCLAGVEGCLRRNGPRSFACVFVEPVLGGGGAVPLAVDLSKALRELCDRYDIRLVSDEVITGFGRTGEWFGSMAVGLKPDAMVLAKGLTGGYAPLGAAVFERSWAEELHTKSFPYGLTFGGHPLGCAAARETIRILKEEALVQRAKNMGGYLRKRLERLAADHPTVVRDVRGMGLLQALELRGPPTGIGADRRRRHAGRSRGVSSYMKRRLEELGREPGALARDLRGAGRFAVGLVGPSQGRHYKTHPAWARVQSVWQGLLDEGLRLWTNSDGSSLMFCPPFIVSEAQVDSLAARLGVHLDRIVRLDAAPSAQSAPGVI